MKPLEEHMGMYTAYHRHPANRFIHFFMVPAIAWTLIVWADLWTLFSADGLDITFAFPLVGIVLLWYLMLDFALGVAMVAMFTILMVTAIQLNSAVPAGTSALIALAVFVGSWIFQLIGHGVWEKRRPALAENLTQVFIAPMFLVAETLFAMGFRKELEERVEVVAAKHAKPSSAN
jgi:uncharacterized membrane protein YGL010W